MLYSSLNGAINFCDITISIGQLQIDMLQGRSSMQLPVAAVNIQVCSP